MNILNTTKRCFLTVCLACLPAIFGCSGEATDNSENNRRLHSIKYELSGEATVSAEPEMKQPTASGGGFELQTSDISVVDERPVSETDTFELKTEDIQVESSKNRKGEDKKRQQTQEPPSKPEAK